MQGQVQTQIQIQRQIYIDIDLNRDKDLDINMQREIDIEIDIEFKTRYIDKDKQLSTGIHSVLVPEPPAYTKIHTYSSLEVSPVEPTNTKVGPPNPQVSHPANTVFLICVCLKKKSTYKWTHPVQTHGVQGSTV